MEVTIATPQAEDGDLCPRPKSKGKIGLVRKLTKGGPPKLFLMKNKKTSDAKGSKARQSESCTVLRYQAGVAASDVLQEDDETATGGDGKKRSYSENTKVSPWAVASGIDETVFEDNTASGDNRSTGEENEETWPPSSLNPNGPLPEIKGQNRLSKMVPVEHKTKSRKEPRQKGERRRKGPRGSSAAWGALICVKKTRKSRVNEAERRSLNGPPACPETKGETQKQSCIAARVCMAQSEDTCNSTGSRNRAEALQQNLPLSGGSGLSVQEEEGANESKTSAMEGGAEISRSDSQVKLRRKSSGWSSFRYLMKSKKEWRSFAEKNLDCSGSQCQQVESAETRMLQDSQDYEVTASSNTKAPLTKLIRGQKKKAERPSEDPDAIADLMRPARRDSDILHLETIGAPLNGDQDLHPPGVSKSFQPNIDCEKSEGTVGIKGTVPAMLQDEMGLSEDNGQATSVNGIKESDQCSHDFGLAPLESMLSLQTIPQGVQPNIGTARMNPSHLLDTDGFPEETSTRAADLLQEKSIQATLGVVIETKRQGLAKESPDEAGPNLIGSGYLHKPSALVLQSNPLPEQDNTEELEFPEPLSIDESLQTPIQGSYEQKSSNLDELSRKNANSVSYYPKHNTQQILGSQESPNGTMLRVIEQEALSGAMNIELHSTPTPAPSCDSIHPLSCCEEDASYDGQVHECVNWNHLSEDRRCAAKCDSQRGVDPPSDVVPGLEFLGEAEAGLIQTASCIVQSAVRAALEQVAGETTMNQGPENPPASEVLDS